MPKKKIKKPKTRKEKFANEWKKPEFKNDPSSNQDLKTDNATRDGLTKDRVALPQMMVDCLEGIGTEKQGLWYNQRSLIEKIKIHPDYRGLELNKLFSVTIQGLIKSGHVQRALNPKKGLCKYIYRRTDKPFEAKILGEKIVGGKEKIQKGFDIYHKYKDFPKWFRDMLH
jgi:hypothetical protein